MNLTQDAAKSLFMIKIVNGRLPEEVVGGKLDGLRYYVLVLNSQSYWLTEAGLVRRLKKRTQAFVQSK